MFEGQSLLGRVKKWSYRNSVSCPVARAKAIIITRQAGKPAEVLARLELLKPSIEVQAEIEKAKKESEVLKKENAKGRRKALRQLRKLEKGTTALLNEKLPHVLAETERLLQTHNINLMNRYEELSKEHTILRSQCSILATQSAKYQKLLVTPFPSRS